MLGSLCLVICSGQLDYDSQRCVRTCILHLLRNEVSGKCFLTHPWGLGSIVCFHLSHRLAVSAFVMLGTLCLFICGCQLDCDSQRYVRSCIFHWVRNDSFFFILSHELSAFRQLRFCCPSLLWYISEPKFAPNPSFELITYTQHSVR